MEPAAVCSSRFSPALRASDDPPQRPPHAGRVKKRSEIGHRLLPWQFAKAASLKLSLASARRSARLISVNDLSRRLGDHLSMGIQQGHGHVTRAVDLIGDTVETLDAMAMGVTRCRGALRTSSILECGVITPRPRTVSPRSRMRGLW
jgi:hypothetical protein